MTVRGSRLLALVLAPVLTLAAVGVGPTYAGGNSASATSAVQVSTRLVVKWQGYQAHPTYSKVANVPGIGQVELMCRPNNTILRIRANDRRAETQMWMAKYETKNGTDVVAVKKVRIYTYATAADDGRGGTGPQAHEGLNQGTHGIEDYANGSAYGVISQRPGRHRPGGGQLQVPATSFKLTWYWERFAYPGSQYCRMTLALNTDTDRQFGLNWHGSVEAETTSTSSRTIPGLGDALLTCETGDNGERSVALRPPAYDPAADPDGTGEPYLDYEYIQGEGSRSNPDVLRRYNDLKLDRVTGLLGPVDLPGNGMMRLWFAPHGSQGPKVGYVLSAYTVPSNRRRPELTTCEVAAAPI